MSKLDLKKDENIEDIDAINIVNLSRDKKRPKPIDYIDRYIKDPFFHRGDRRFGDDRALITGIGKLNDIIITFIATNKARDIDENAKNNFGMVNPEGYRKAMRAMNLAEKFKRPVVIFIDTPGAYPGVGAEKRGQANAIAESIYTMSKLKVPIITIITGEGASGGAIALGVCDHLIMMENSIYSILSPEGFASILWKDINRADEAKKLMKLTSYELYDFSICDEIIKEERDKHIDRFDKNFDRLYESISKKLIELKDKDIDKLLLQRREKLRKINYEFK